MVLSSDVLGKLGEYQRSMTAILDAYLHRSLQIELSAMWDKLREYGYEGSFMMVQNSGGVAEIYKATASRTYNGGPVAGLIGSRDIARQLGYTNVVASDIGVPVLISAWSFLPMCATMSSTRSSIAGWSVLP